jgi:hypothetical protein
MDLESLIQKLDNIYINNINIINQPTDISNVTSNVTSDITSNVTSNVTESETVDLQYSEDEYLYRKPWTKLNNIHKIIKIKDYLRGLDLDKSVKKDLEKILITLVKKKILTKKDKVNYNQKEGHISSIPNLDITKGKYLN